MLLPLWNIAELPSVPELSVNTGMKLAAIEPAAATVRPAPLAVTFPAVVALVLVAAVPEVLAPNVPEAAPVGCANTNADAGIPPRVSASAAFKA
jgi:hypothetical protein